MATETVEHYVSRFAEVAAANSASSPQWLNNIRKNAIDQFAAMGFPSGRDEKWRFTNFSSLARKKFAVPNGQGASVSTSLDEAPGVGWWSDTRIVFVDGKLSIGLSSLGELPDGVYAGNVFNALSDNATKLEQSLATIADVADNPFAALNAAFFTDGGVLIIPEGVRVESPIQFLYLASDDMHHSVSSLRSVFMIGENAEVTIVESFLGLGSGCSWTNAVTEMIVADGANLKAHRFQQESPNAFHTATTQCRQGRDSNLTFSTVDFGSSLSRHDICFQLNGTGASCSLRGLSHLRDKQHADNQTTIEHVTPNCSSVEQFTGIFDDSSHGVFTGRVLVRPDAQQTDAMQSSRNLLLSDNARADTQPQLEIFADDVKCTHGSTVGPIDDDALFYLRSKGLSAEEARTMLTYGFAIEIIDTIGISGLREFLADLLKSRLRSQSRDPQGAG
jgi:Fe-S cluster assembly protein SufD